MRPAINKKQAKLAPAAGHMNDKSLAKKAFIVAIKSQSCSITSTKVMAKIPVSIVDLFLLADVFFMSPYFQRRYRRL